MATQLTINGVEDAIPAGIEDLEHLLQYTVDRKMDQEIVVEVKVDGARYSEVYPHQAREVDLAGVGSVEVVTQGMDGFARSFLEQVPELVNGLTLGFRRSSELLRDPDKEEDGHDLLARSLEALSDMKTHMANVREVLRGSDAVSESVDFWERFEHIADEVIDAQEEMDAVLIADLMEEQMIPLLGDYR